MMLDRYGEPRPAFAAWLLLQKDREDSVGRLAHAARSDRSFPREGDADAVRAHLNRMQADGESFEAVDDAETDWLSY
ncbi:YozE family protein [Sphingomonas sp. ac-8]|uniref:YozE family protein n=1 Tax=Sphingomonas sp. ac-8 TaxID=3242977 RepID=UPI003A7FBE40